MAYYSKYVTLNGVDITQYVKNIEINVGCADSDSRVGAVGTISLTVNNSSKIFSPSNTLSAFYNNILSKTIIVFLSPPVPLLGLPPPPVTVFSGKVQSVQAESGAFGDASREATIEASDFMFDLQSSTIALPIQYDKTADEVIQLILARIKRTASATGSYGYVSGLTGFINDGETVTVNDVTYRWKSTLAQANDVKLESDAYGQKRNHCLENLAAAINGAQGEGTRYFALSSRPTGVTASINTNNYYRIVMANNPTRYYRMNETAGSVAYDYGENPRNAGYTNSPTFTTNSAIYNEEPYTAPQFNGSNQYMDIPPIDIKGASCSFRMWFKVLASSPPANQTLFHIGTSAANSGIVANVGSSGTRLSLKVNSTTYNGTVNSVTPGTWHHLTVAYDAINQTLKAWIGSTLVIDETGVSSVTANTDLFHMGKLTNGTTYLKGDVCEFSFYYQNILTSGTTNAGNTPPRLTLKANTNGAWANGITVSENSANISRFDLSGGANVSSPVVSLETGVPVFDIVGESWSESNTNAYSAIEELVTSERGFFFCRPNGTLKFFNRDYENRLVTVSPDVTYTDRHLSLETSYSLDEVFNKVIVTYTPRRTLTEGIIARNEQVINAPGKWGQANRPPDLQPEGYFNINDPLPPYGTTKIKIPYVDQETGQICGARSLRLPPEPNVDFTAGDGQNGSGTDTYTTFSGLKFSCVPTASGVDVTIENQALGTLYIHGFQLRGVGIVKYDDVAVERRDETSITTYGERALNVSIPIGGTQEYAEALAEYLLSRYKDPRVTLKAATFGHTETTSIIGGAYSGEYILGKVFNLTDTQLGISGFKGVCVGMKLSISLENALSSTFILREIQSTQAWILGTHALNTTSRLGV